MHRLEQCKEGYCTQSVQNPGVLKLKHQKGLSDFIKNLITLYL